MLNSNQIFKMTKVGGYWREAATLIIASRSRSDLIPKQVMDKEKKTRHLTACDYEVLMLKRSAKSKFMPDVHVFPGGVISEADFSPKWISLFEGYKSPFTETVRQLQCRKNVLPLFDNRPASILPAEVAFRICAIRECYEESGTLIARRMKHNGQNKETFLRPLSSADLNSRSWRSRVNKDASQFLVMCLENDLVPDIWSLYDWSNWLTPVMKPVDKPPAKPHRFDTVFYVCCVDTLPSVNVDKRETVDTQLQSPYMLIHQQLTEQLRLNSPQFYELSRLCNFNTLSGLHDFVKQREGEGLERWMPVILFCSDGIVSLMPGDEMYPEDPDYEGKKQFINFEGTVAELTEKSVRQRRSNRDSNNIVERYIQRNVTLKCGQPRLVDSVYVTNGKL